MTALENLALSLFDIGAVRFGRFKLHSDRESPIYIDLRVLVSFPAVLKEVGRAYATILETMEFDILSAYPYAGLPLGVATSLEMNKPLIYPRKEIKTYGTGKHVEGIWKVGQRVVLIEDLITSGKSIIEACSSMKTAGLQIGDAVVLIDRQQGGVEVLARQGINVRSIMTLSRLLAYLESHERIDGNQRDEVVRALSIK
jgi:uridine monophosphate synthetase